MAGSSVEKEETGYVSTCQVLGMFLGLGGIMQLQIRTITARENLYLRLEDVVKVLDAFGDTEETDVRNRMRELTSNLMSLETK